MVRFRLMLMSLVILGSNTPGAAEKPTHSGLVNLPAPLDHLDIVTMLPGIAEPARQAVLAAPLSGVLMSVKVREGDQVKPGQILAVMDNRIAAAELQYAKVTSRQTAEIGQAQVTLQHAKSLLLRLLSVEDRRALSELEVEQATNRRDQAAALLDAVREQASSAGAKLELAKTRLEVHNIRAPLAGQVIRVDAQPGQTLSGPEPVVHIVDMRTLRVSLRVPVTFFGKLEPGDGYHLAASAPVNRSVPATLVACEPMIDAATQTFRCVFEMDNANRALPAGFATRLVRPRLQ